jgi:hypothetical protein
MLAYYIRKLIRTGKTHLYAWRYGTWQAPGVLCVPGSIRNSDIFFDFSDTQSIHLGDQLFHLPLIAHLSKNGFNVWVSETALSGLWKSQGAQCGTPGAEPALIVTKSDTVLAARKRFSRSTVLGFNYAAFTSKRRVAEDIAHYVYQQLIALQLAKTAPDTLSLPTITASEKTRELAATLRKDIPETSKGIIAWNTTIESGFIGNRGRDALLKQCARTLHDEGYSIVHVGSAKERLVDLPPYITADWSGLLPPATFIEWLTLPECTGVISYDTFIAHAATIARKPMWLVVRTKRVAAMMRKKYVPFTETHVTIRHWE